MSGRRNWNIKYFNISIDNYVACAGESYHRNENESRKSKSSKWRNVRHRWCKEDAELNINELKTHMPFTKKKIM